MWCWWLSIGLLSTGTPHTSMLNWNKKSGQIGSIFSSSTCKIWWVVPRLNCRRLASNSRQMTNCPASQTSLGENRQLLKQKVHYMASSLSHASLKLSTPGTPEQKISDAPLLALSLWYLLYFSAHPPNLFRVNLFYKISLKSLIGEEKKIRLINTGDFWFSAH